MRWIGRSIMAIAALHFFAAFLIYPTGVLEAFGYSLAGSIPPLTVASEAYWFLFFAFPALMVGLLIDKAEMRGVPVGIAVPVVMLVMLATMLIPMPENGAWLLVPPAVALFMRERRLRSDQELQNEH